MAKITIDTEFLLKKNKESADRIQMSSDIKTVNLNIGKLELIREIMEEHFKNKETNVN